MVVLILERVPVGLRGELSRWMLEPRTGVFVGRLSALVRDKLWEYVKGKCRRGGCTMVHRASNEQGFKMRTWGATSREIVDFDGLQLVRIPKTGGSEGTG